MHQKELASAVKVTATHLNAVLCGRRNPSAKLASNLEKHTGISRALWVFGTARERRAAWKKFQKKQSEITHTKP